MLRRTTYVFLLALAIALPLAVVGASNDPASAGKARRATLLFASFDSLATGQMTGTKFQSQFGGVQYANWIFDDSTVASAEKSYRVRLEAGTINGNPSSGNHGIALAVRWRGRSTTPASGTASASGRTSTGPRVASSRASPVSLPVCHPPSRPAAATPETRAGPGD